MGIYKNVMRFSAVLTVVGIIVLAPVSFAQASISEGFTTSDKLASGTIVSQREGDSSIQTANPDNVKSILGVVSKQSLLELSKSDTKQTQVVTSGTTQTLVSDINGKIKAGDKITISPLEGIGMRVATSGYVVGTAVVGFDQAQNTSTREIRDKNGKMNEVTIGSLPVQVNVTYYEDIDVNKSILPQFILNIAQFVAGKDVSVLRILIALLVLVVGIISIGVLMYSSVRSSIISIGRNPLAASAVNKSLLEVSFVSLGVLLVMLSAVYLVLIV